MCVLVRACIRGVCLQNTHTGLHLCCHVGDQCLWSGSLPAALLGHSGLRGRNGGKEEFTCLSGEYLLCVLECLVGIKISRV